MSTSSEYQRRRCVRLFAIYTALAAWLMCAPSVLLADEIFSPEQIQFFETNIRPLLARHCYECHSEKSEELQGELRLDERATLLQGGKSGAAVVPGDPEASLLISAVRYESLEMPPKRKLPARDVELITQWVRMGAPFPASADGRGAERLRDEFEITDEDRKHWSYRPIARPDPPQVANRKWASSAIDLFVLRRLEAEGLAPNAPATKRELIRRAYFDLIGLPPTPEEIDQTVADPSPQAWPKLIDNLLARPQYGERWGRHWLDVVRFAQTNGYEYDADKPKAWRYRDYVIRAFNQDMPFDQFVVEQLAGDELEELTDDSLTATGFYRLGVWDEDADDKRAAEFDGLDDMLSTIGQAFLGQTIGCARCHDHMFDPIAQKDYYRMLAFVRNVKYYDTTTDDNKKATILSNLPSGNGWALTVREHGRDPLATHLLIRGDAGTPSDEVHPAVLEVLRDATDDGPAELPAAPEGRSSSGRRSVLARWIASADNPLTARVITNRIWQHHFRQGIVRTPNDFGRAGLAPTHPALLDWLAAELIAGNWSIKQLHRTIMLSTTYQMSSRAEGPAAVHDPGNQLLWRQNLRRLDAEAIRDSVLAVGGQLNLEPGGRGVFPRVARGVVAGQSRPGWGWDISSPEERRRRSVYIFVKRGVRVPMIESFDYVNTTSPLAVRTTTTVAPQALILLNSRFMTEQSAALAERIRNEAGDDQTAQVQRLYRLAVGRSATEDELARAQQFLTSQAEQLVALTGQVTFRPNVPLSLFKDYHSKLPAEEYLIGPRGGWSYYKGEWGSVYENIHTVDIRQAPFVLWQAVELGDGVIQGRLKMHNASELATLLVRASPRDASWQGYGIELDARSETLKLVRRGEKTESLAGVDLHIPVGVWQDFRIELIGNCLRFWIDSATDPIIDVRDAAAVKSGRLGVSTWGGSLSLNNVMIAADGGHWDLARHEAASDQQRARDESLAALCLVVLNSNEFVYVD